MKPLAAETTTGAAERPLPTGSAAAFWIMALTVVAMIAYWGIWFFVDRDWLATAHTSEYYAFENAFPLADAFMTAVSLFGALALRRRQPSAVLWMLVGGGASVYLGCMDVLFDLEHGIYRAPTGDWGGVTVEVLVNLATLIGGGWILRFAWKNRAALLGQ